MAQDFKAWNLEEAISYYERLRNKPEDIYESERVFFFPLLRKIGSVLDVGCAAGGFYNIIKTVNPGINYTGIDVSEKMIHAAKNLFPGTDFKLTAGDKIDFPDNSFDLVFSLGVLNHVLDYKSFISECFRVSKKYCLIDLPRLLPRPHAFSEKPSFMLLKDRFHSNRPIDSLETKVPYVLEDAAEVFSFLKNGLKAPKILAKGYFGKCDKSAILPVEEVCFAVVCIEKRSKENIIIADLPISILARLKAKGIMYMEPFESIIES